MKNLTVIIPVYELNEEKNVLLLKYSGFSNKEISSVLFISEDTIRQRLFRAKNLILKMGGGRFHD